MDCFAIIFLLGGVQMKKSREDEQDESQKKHKPRCYFDFDKLRNVNKWYTFQRGGPTGKGTYGKVRRAHGASGERVAIKCFESSAEGQKSAYHDVKYLTRLRDHPNIVNVIEMMTNETRLDLFMIMEEARCDLSKLIFRKEAWRISEGQIKGYALQLFQALAFCHKNQVMHLDVKPQNVLVMATNVVKLTDFGLSQIKKPNQRYSTNVVTQWYRPPEILLCATDYDYAVDMWSAGCVLVEMLDGKHFLPGVSGNEHHQCQITWEMCGSPALSQWPEWAHTRIAKTVKEARERTLMQRLSQRPERFKPEAKLLIDGLLALLPSQRLTAAQVLDHEYWKVYQRPLTPAQMIFPQFLFTDQKKPEPKKDCYAHNMQPKGKQRVTK